jgi:hypothetical protein
MIAGVAEIAPCNNKTKGNDSHAPFHHPILLHIFSPSENTIEVWAAPHRNAEAFRPSSSRLPA